MKPAIVFTLIIFLLSGCAPAITAVPPASDMPVLSLADTATPAPTTTLTLTSTLTPDTPILDTPIPDTPTVTPLPTFPTFTPTFDVRTIVTATPAPKAECPQSIPVQNPNVGFLDFSFDKQENRANDERNILYFVNQYGLGSFGDVLRAGNWKDGMDYAIQDFTNDGLPDIIFRAGSTYIFGCVAGKYETLLVLPPDGNRNNIPEIIFLTAVESQGGRIYRIYEWNRNHFSNLIPSEYPDAPEEG